MPRSLRLCAIAALVAAGTAAASPDPAAAQTDEMTSPTIAVLDAQKIMEQSKAVQSIQDQISERRSSYQNQLSQKEQQIRKANQQLQQQRSVLSSEAYQQKKKKLEQRIQQIQGDVQSRKKGLQQLYNRAMNRVKEKLVQITSKMAEEKNLDMVVNKSAVLLVRRQMEITQAALEKLNNQLKTVDLDKIEKSKQQ
ncbi:periplasmic chaperone for outer membrane proteins Skp [Limimonas halophila]|uniref:Periplasmic chaperone for outer membrane proteins Skp n=1 Tax=Limimonas halophila TaxID=1082479 RepID=A0A1G7N9S5_9PROT|nr:OmpH family outer membrane protein [Limimonas halophila]SDF70706.1 periplasmic chaperone for outer membrane proteins Skp [Limimonas halophila]